MPAVETRLAGISGTEAVVVSHVPGRRELEDLVLDRLADARDLGRVPGAGRPTATSTGLRPMASAARW
jgi:hypothetical protein